MTRPAWCIVLLVAALAPLSGCRRQKPIDPVEGQVSENLSVIARAYNKAIEKNKKPPASVEDLKPFLPTDKPADSLLKSVRDGEPFVILWGTDPRTGMDVKPLVIAYEKKGQGGKRMVFTAMGVMTMNEAGFAEARFPAGHKP